MVAPIPAACAARAAAGSMIRPIAARSTPAATRARSMPVVSLLPPAPGLSWVSAITTGFEAPADSRTASATASSGW